MQETASTNFEELLLCFQWLDTLLEKSIAAIQVNTGLTELDPYQGLHLTQEYIEQLLQAQSGTSFLSEASLNESFISLIRNSTHLSHLAEATSLSAFDIAVIIIALAPEIDRRYERIYAYLQDDITCKLPTVDLALNLLCDSGAAKLFYLDCFAPNAPLFQNQILHLIPEPNQPHSTLLSHYLSLDPQIIRLLLGQQGLDSQLAYFCQLINPQSMLPDFHLNIQTKQALSRLTLQSQHTHQPLRLYFEGIDQATKHDTAKALAKLYGTCLLMADLAQIKDTGDTRTILDRLFREARLQSHLLYLDHLDTWKEQNYGVHYTYLLEAIANYPGITILAGTESWVPTITEVLGIVSVKFAIPNFEVRKTCWQRCLSNSMIPLKEADLDALVDRFQFTPSQIANTVATACNKVHWQSAAFSEQIDEVENIPKLEDLYAAARTQTGHELTALAQKIEPRYHLSEVVLPPTQQKQLQEICNHVKFRHIVYDEWGFSQKLSLGKGLNVLFFGSPGTGKTMAAEAIAHELQLDLYKIDLSQIVSKYIGETEKNLNRIFTAAQNANAILLFDEADALIGKRSDVKDAHDRYSNIEIAYLLQKMEEYEGISILTTNLLQNLDQAFTRRMRFMIEFPFPKENYRLRIWQNCWPQKEILFEGINLKQIAKKFELSGGDIRNIALSSAFLAASEGQKCIDMKHLLQAIKREFQKMGRLINEADFTL